MYHKVISYGFPVLRFNYKILLMSSRIVSWTVYHPPVIFAQVPYVLEQTRTGDTRPFVHTRTVPTVRIRKKCLLFKGLTLPVRRPIPAFRGPRRVARLLPPSAKRDPAPARPAQVGVGARSARPPSDETFVLRGSLETPAPVQPSSGVAWSRAGRPRGGRGAGPEEAPRHQRAPAPDRAGAGWRCGPVRPPPHREPST